MKFMHDNNKEIGKKIQARRKELGMTQEELAHLLGFSNKASVTKIENGTRELNIYSLKQISLVLGLDYDSLVGFSEFMDDSNRPTKKVAQATHKLLNDPELTDVVLQIADLEPEKKQQVIQAIKLMLN